MFTLFQVLLILTKGQRLDQFNIFLSSAERKVLIGHLDIDHLDGVFLTRRQGLALQEEEYLRWVGGVSSLSSTESFRSLGYQPFGADSDSLLTLSTTTTTEPPLERKQALSNDTFGLVKHNSLMI